METKEKNMSGHAATCDCNYCQPSCWAYGQNHKGIFIVRILLGLLILLIVFWLGLQIGELKGYIENNYGDRAGKMMLYDGQPRSNMMWNYGASAAAPASQATPVPQTNPLPTSKTAK